MVNNLNFKTDFKIIFIYDLLIILNIKIIFQYHSAHVKIKEYYCRTEK